MQRISIKRPSEKVISRMRNSHAVRMMQGEGLDVMLKPEKIAKMAKKFLTGRGIQISLDPEEIEANREVSGCGIFGKKADKFMEKKGIKKAVYAIGSVAKPFVQEGIKAAEAMAIAYGVPPTIASKIGETASQYVDDPESLQGKKGLRELKRRGIELGQEGLDMISSEFGVDKVDLAGIVKKATPKKAKEMAQQSVGNFRRDARSQMGGARQSLADKLEARFSDVPQGNGLYVGRGIGLGVMSRARKALRGSTGDIKSILSSTKSELSDRVDDLRRQVMSAPDMLMGNGLKGAFGKASKFGDVKDIIARQENKLKDGVADLERQVRSETDMLMNQVRSAPDMLMGQGMMRPMAGYGARQNIGRATKFAERTLSGRNSLLGGAMPQALQSQPYSENFQFGATLGLMR